MKLTPRLAALSLIAVLLVPSISSAHEIADLPAVVIDTDLGLDDAVMLAVALQSPDIDIVGIVFTEGACGRDNGIPLLERLLDRFNRRDIPLYVAANHDEAKAAPPFRPFVESTLFDVLPRPVEPFCRPLTPEAYKNDRQKTMVAALGPLTNLAAAVQADPTLKDRIAHVLVTAAPTDHVGWNIAFDEPAFEKLKAAEVPMDFIVSDSGATKPEDWTLDGIEIGPDTSVGECFFDELMADADVRRHYLQQFTRFHDELAQLYLVCPSCFAYQRTDSVLTARNRREIGSLFEHCLATGRQGKPGVVLAFDSLPDSALHHDLVERRDRIIAKNGRDEWVAQLLMNELHEHLGAYSIIGVKMGLYAGELLNAPRHSMTVVSHSAASPPVSCLNDGIIVSTGCTPGRVLFTHEPGPPGSTEVVFTYHDRTIALSLKPKYRDAIRTEIMSLLKEHTLEDAAYWEGVRRFGLDLWENWHRRDLFEVRLIAPSNATTQPHTARTEQSEAP